MKYKMLNLHNMSTLSRFRITISHQNLWNQAQLRQLAEWRLQIRSLRCFSTLLLDQIPTPWVSETWCHWGSGSHRTNQVVIMRIQVDNFLRCGESSRDERIQIVIEQATLQSGQRIEDSSVKTSTKQIEPSRLKMITTGKCEEEAVD